MRGLLDEQSRMTVNRRELPRSDSADSDTKSCRKKASRMLLPCRSLERGLRVSAFSTHRFWFGWLVGWLVGSTSSGGVRARYCPDEASELARDRSDRDRRPLAPRLESLEATCETEIRSTTDVGDCRRLLRQHLSLS